MRLSEIEIPLCPFQDKMKLQLRTIMIFNEQKGFVTCSIHVISLKKESGRFSFHFREVFQMYTRICKKVVNSFQGDFLIL